MKISRWILAITLVAAAWAQAPAKVQPAEQTPAKPRVGTITPVKPAKAAHLESEQAQAHKAKTEAMRAASNKTSAAHALPKKAKAVEHKAAEHKAAEHKAAEHKAAGHKALPGKGEESKSAQSKSAESKGAESKGAEKEKASADESVPRLDNKHERDPFVSPIVERPAGVKCTGTGRQCLFVRDVELQGVVECSSGFIAVVASGVHTYFLRDKDPLADGEVERIGKNAIIMRQRSSDVLGRPVEREVTKTLGGPPA